MARLPEHTPVRAEIMMIGLAQDIHEMINPGDHWTILTRDYYPIAGIDIDVPIPAGGITIIEAPITITNATAFDPSINKIFLIAIPGIDKIRPIIFFDKKIGIFHIVIDFTAITKPLSAVCAKTASQNTGESAGWDQQLTQRSIDGPAPTSTDNSAAA